MRGIGLLILSILCRLLRIRVRFNLVVGAAAAVGAAWRAAAVGAAAAFGREKARGGVPRAIGWAAAIGWRRVVRILWRLLRFSRSRG